MKNEIKKLLTLLQDAKKQAMQVHLHGVMEDNKSVAIEGDTLWSELSEAYDRVLKLERLADEA